jgi:DNA-binding transcriptional ArsR family regulator
MRTFVPVTDDMIEEAARRFALLSDPTRLRILHRLLEQGEESVTELAEAIGVARANVSQHLSRLLGAGMVGRRRSGHSVHYTIVDETLAPLCDLICSAIEERTKRLAAQLDRRAG